MTWSRGKPEVDRLVADGELERVTPSDEVAARLLDNAEAHLELAAKGIADDPAGALQLSYDAARKAAAALLAVQGLRATSRGGHIAVLDAVRAQFDDHGQLDTFGKVNRLRRRRTLPSTRTPTRPPSARATPNKHWPLHATPWTPPGASSAPVNSICSGRCRHPRRAHGTDVQQILEHLAASLT